MSLLVTKKVWNAGPRRPLDRFVLVALADFADQNGRCWPSVGLLAHRTGLSIRGVQNILRRLEADGWMATKQGRGRGGSNIYTIQLDRYPAPDARLDREETPQDTAETPHAASGNPASGAPEPSVTTKDPSEDISSDVLKCAVNLFNESAARVGWPRIQAFTVARQRALSKRLKEAGGISGWRVALEKGEASDFLCGKVRGQGGNVFFANFDFLTKQSTFTRLMEGVYDNRSGPLGIPPVGRRPVGPHDAMFESFRRTADRKDAPP